MTPEGKAWKDLYEFDTPVVGLLECSKGRELYADGTMSKIHVSSSKGNEEVPELAAKAKKLMHRFSAEQVRAKMDEVDKEASV